MASITGLELYTLNEVTIVDKSVEEGVYATTMHLEYLGLKCAGKRIHTSLLNDGAIVVRYMEECAILSEIRHPNIVQFLGVFFSSGETTPTLVTELIPTSLTSCIERYGEPLPKEFAYSILNDVVLGLRYLHSKHPPIIHSDLSSNSIVLTPMMTAKIADLGVARIIPSTYGGSQATNVLSGTRAFKPIKEGSVEPDTSADIFSYGVIMIHIFSGKWPEHQVEQQQSKKKSRKVIPVTEVKCREHFLQAIGKDHPMMELICKCIDDISEQRPNAREVLGKTSEMVAKFPPRIPDDPMDMVKVLVGEGEKVTALKQALDEKKTTIQKQEQRHSLEVEKLQQYLEHLRLPLISTKQPIQADITWKLCKHPPPAAIAPVQSAVINGKVYLGGGESEHVYCYDPLEDKWTSLPPLPTKQFGLGQFSGTLVAVGGVNYSNQQPTSTLYTLTGSKLQKWDTKMPPMPTARHSVAVAGLPSALLVVGGTLGTGKSTSTVEVFKTETAQWYKTNYFHLPTPCSNPSLAIVDDTLYIVGGYNEGDRLSHYLNQALYASVNDILAFAEYDEIEYDEIDGSSDVEWKTLHHTPSYHPVAVVLDGNLLATCGHETPETTTLQKKVYMFRPSINSWVYVSDLPEFIQCTTSAKLSSKEVLVVGSDANKLTTVFKGSVATDMNIQV